MLSIPPNIPSPSTLSNTYESTYNQQTTFTVWSIFNFMKQWSTTQCKYLKLNHLPNDKDQDKTGIVSLGRLLSSHLQTLWSIRNQQVHQHVPTQTISYKWLELLAQLKIAYSKKITSYQMTAISLTDPSRNTRTTPTDKSNPFYDTSNCSWRPVRSAPRSMVKTFNLSPTSFLS